MHSSLSQLGLFVAVGALLVAASGCSKADGAKDAPASSASTTTGVTAAASAKPAAAAAAPAPAAAGLVSCKALIAHIVDVQEAEKKDGLINRKNADENQAGCEKANNIKDNGETVTCVMAAKDTKTLGACKNMGKLLRPW